MEKEFKDFEEFWPYYALEHSDKLNRTLHFWGTTAGAALGGYGIITRKLLWLALAPAVGYGAAWVGHFFVEGNKPASFGSPWLSFLGDMKMYGLIATGKMDAEIERLQRERDIAAEDADFARQGNGSNGESVPADVSVVSPDPSTLN